MFSGFDWSSTGDDGKPLTWLLEKAQGSEYYRVNGRKIAKLEWTETTSPQMKQRLLNEMWKVKSEKGSVIKAKHDEHSITITTGGAENSDVPKLTRSAVTRSRLAKTALLSYGLMAFLCFLLHEQRNARRDYN